jgi:hypothetical protein
MEVALLAHNSIRIKEKQTSFVVDPQEKVSANGILLVKGNVTSVQIEDDSVLVYGPGEYEIGGIKLSGLRSENDVLYSLTIGGMAVIVGEIKALEKMQQKLKEHNVVIALCNEVSNASFLTTLATNVIMFYGEKAAEVGQSLSRENVKTVSKYSTTHDKLPQEAETIILE